MKKKDIFILVIVILLIDQFLKIYIKTNFYHGESRQVIGDFFKLTFIENPGMAYGMNYGGQWGKLALTIFRLIAVIVGTGYLMGFVDKKMHKGFIICASLIYAGAIGNLLDSVFYGSIFDTGLKWDGVKGDYTDADYSHISISNFKGYSKPFMGNVVDMLHFTIIDNKQIPEWVPFFGGKKFTFFEPIFNIADAAITTGVISIIVFQNKFFKKNTDKNNSTIETKASVTDDSHVQ